MEQVEQVGTNLENGILKIKQPRKIQDKYFSKVKYLSETSEPVDLIIQLPKMKLIEPLVTKNYSLLEISNTKGTYSSKIKKQITDIDNEIIQQISLNCEKWFDKKLPIQIVTNMYQPVLVGDSIKVFVDIPIIENHKKELIDFDELSTGDNIECIIKLKYLVFTKSDCYPCWELLKVKKCQVRIKRVKKYGFVEQDPCSDSESESELTQIQQSYSFF